jgi:GGDEF domain-containing protein
MGPATRVRREHVTAAPREVACSRRAVTRRSPQRRAKQSACASSAWTGRRPGASIGVALSGRDAFDPERLLRDADVAMYSAKAAGKGTFELYESPAQTRAHRLQLASDVTQTFE